ncbi:MAG TPA: hypothetical protein VFZ83_04905 [Acidimicrobiia bacterium]|nr:hypothetical protein [Acidimicrobiia bacterium]
MEFLVFVVVASAVGIAAVLVRNRRPTSMEHSITEFERGLHALRPPRSAGAMRRTERGAGTTG